jgi:Fic family protein
MWGVNKMLFDRVDKKKEKLDTFRPLPPNTVKSLNENLIVNFTYNSNAIEGNTLTMSETKVVLEGITIGGKTMREHLEVINHKEAILFLQDIVQRKEPLTAYIIKNIHALVLKTIDHENAGQYRKENVIISGAKHRPPAYYLVSEQMQDLIAAYTNDWKEKHPIERASLLHGEFVKIHPFIDGNGRTARLLMNFELMRLGYPPSVITANKRSQYYDALDLAHTTGIYEQFINLVIGCVDDALDLWLSVC